MLEHPSDEGVPGLVISHDLSLRRAQHVVLLLWTGDHALDRVLQIIGFDLKKRKMITFINFNIFC